MPAGSGLGEQQPAAIAAAVLPPNALQQLLEVFGVAIQIGEPRAGHLLAQAGAALADGGQISGELTGNGAVVGVVCGDPLGFAKGGEEAGTHP